MHGCAFVSGMRYRETGIKRSIVDRHDVIARKGKYLAHSSSRQRARNAIRPSKRRHVKMVRIRKGGLENAAPRAASDAGRGFYR
jgi:hypothetical protein